jgi:hypothetical protein
VYRDRLKRVEMTVYERVENEYSQVLLKKDQQIHELNTRLEGQEQEIIAMRRVIEEEREAREIEREAE